MSITAIQRQPSLQGACGLLQSAGLPISDLTQARLEHFFYCGDPAAPVGLVGLEIYDSSALLRSLVVAPGQRATGLGSALLDHAERYALTRGVRSLFLLTTTAEKFFSQRGYAAADRSSAPPSIRTTAEFAGICPASSAFMVKTL